MIRIFFVLIFSMGILAPRAGLAHEGCEHCTEKLEVANVINHYLAFYEIFLDEAERDLAGASSLFIQHDFAFANKKSLAKTRLVSAVQRALKRYQESVERQQIPETFHFESLKPRFMRKLWLSFVEAGASGIEGAARYGALFGLSYALWELTEHLILKGIPIGSGPLCAVFPLIWTSVIIPLMSPLDAFLINPDRESFAKSLRLAFKLPFVKRKLERALNAIVVEGEFRLRKKDERLKPEAGDALEDWLRSSLLWNEGLLFFQGDHLKSQTPSASESFLKSLLERLSDQTEIKPIEALQVQGVLLAPLDLLTTSYENLFSAKAIPLLAYLKARQHLGKLKKVAERLTQSFFRLAQQTSIENSAEHRKEIEGILQDYFSALRGLGRPTETLTPQWSASLKTLQRRVKSFSQGKHLCPDLITRLAESA
jgi:hypothetical protein